MAKKAYVGINNLSKNGKQIYIGVSNLSKKAVKGYIGVGNLSKLFWDFAPLGFWFFYETVAKKIMEYKNVHQGMPPPLTTSQVYKTNDGIAFYCVADSGGYRGDCVAVFSTDANAVAFTEITGSTTRNPTTGSVTINNDTWHYACIDFLQHRSARNLVPDCYIKEASFENYTPAEIMTWIINNRIYTDDFAEDYQIRQTYNAVFGDREKTIRKAVAIWLYRNQNFKGYGAYDALLANLDTIIDELLNRIEDDDKINVGFSNVVMSSGSRIVLGIYSTANDFDTFSLRYKHQTGGYTYFDLSSNLRTTRYTYALIEGTVPPSIRYYSDLTSGNISMLGTYASSSQYTVDKGVTLSNLGLNLQAEPSE